MIFDKSMAHGCAETLFIPIKEVVLRGNDNTDEGEPDK